MARLIYVIAFTTDFDRMRDFYQRGLGLAPRQQQPGWVVFDTGGPALALRATEDDARRGIELRFESEDAVRDRDLLEERGVELDGDVEDHPFGRCLEVRDPEERPLSFLQPAQPFRPGTGLPLGTVILNCDDLGRALTWYREGLGLRIVRQDEHWIELDTETARLALHQRHPRTDGPLHATPGVALAFDVPDLDVFADELRGRGTHFAAAPVEEEFGLYAEIMDPDGNIVVFRQPPAPAALEEVLAEAFEDDGSPARTAMRRPVKKNSKAVSRVAIRPEYHNPTVPARRRPSATTMRVASVRGAGPERSRLVPKRTADEKKARGKPAIGRGMKAERATLAQKKRAVAGSSKGRLAKRSAGRPKARARSAGLRVKARAR
jgi:catechol 2,3-dioxygenase-like lactoylglutathione lyase family enzyme